MSHRNKYIKKIIAVILICFVIGTGMNITAAAAEGNISSKGNLVLKTGSEVALYTEDIQYLQKELNVLFNEITE